MNRLDEQVKNLRAMMEDLEKSVSEMEQKQNVKDLKEAYDKKIMDVQKEVERIEAEIKKYASKPQEEPNIETPKEPISKPKIQEKPNNIPAYAYANMNNANKPVETKKETVMANNKPNIVSEKKDKKNSFEENLGKVGLPIIAAVLIFLSFVYFANYVAPLLTDKEKVGIMTGVSLVFIIAGLVGAKFIGKMLANAVAGIGVGALFITIVATHMYFEMISSSVLLLLLMVWVTSVAAISWFRDKLFYYIGEVGMVIAVLLGVVQITGVTAKVQDTKDIIILFLFTVYGTIAFALTNIKEKFKDNYPTYIQFSLSMILFIPVLSTMIRKDINGYYALLILMTIIFMMYELYKNLLHIDKGDGYLVSFGVDAVIMSIATYVTIDSSMKFFAIIATVFLILIPARSRFEKSSVVSSKIDMVAIATSAVAFVIEAYYKISYMSTDNIFKVFGEVKGVEDQYYLCAIAATVLLLIATGFAYFKKDKAYAIVALIINLNYSIVATYNSLIILLVELLIMAVMAYKAYKENDSVLKIGIYITSYIPIILVGKMCMSAKGIVDYSSRRILAFIFMGLFVFIINSIAEFTKLKYNCSIKDKLELDNNFFVITTLINGLFFVIVSCVAVDENSFILLLIALLIGSVKTRAMILKSVTEKKYVIIEMVKYWAWSICVYNYYLDYNTRGYIYQNHTNSGFILSIIWLTVSAIFFAYGLIANRKNVREVGMIACIISVAKLIFLDIELDNSLVKMSVYFVGGLIFLGLAKIYSELKDKDNENKDNEENK